MPDGRETSGPERWARFLRRLLRRRFRIADRSMEPTVLPGDRLYVDPRAYRERPPTRGELVVAREAEPPHRYFVKRVAFLPGETPLAEGPPVPAGFVYLLGDNPELSRDSRKFGPVPLGTLVGRVYRCYFPAERRRDF
ncbi:MAG: S26 family signal peptidase [Thermoplasmata archaeon]